MGQHWPEFAQAMRVLGVRHANIALFLATVTMFRARPGDQLAPPTSGTYPLTMRTLFPSQEELRYSKHNFNYLFT